MNTRRNRVYFRIFHAGFSLVELLVVIAIISILMAMYAAVGVRAMSKAKRVAMSEGMRQKHIGKLADSANIARPQPTNEAADDEAIREKCRDAFRQSVDTGGRTIIFTEVLCVVRTEAEFRAYWHTLVNPQASGPIPRSGSGELFVQDEVGNTFTLEWRDLTVLRDKAVYPVMWEFLSTDTRHMSAESLGTTVLFSDGHLEYFPYPSRYPAVRSVAELSQRFMENS